jgi:hypothetical protein
MKKVNRDARRLCGHYRDTRHVTVHLRRAQVNNLMKSRVPVVPVLPLFLSLLPMYGPVLRKRLQLEGSRPPFFSLFPDT